MSERPGVGVKDGAARVIEGRTKIQAVKRPPRSSPVESPAMKVGMRLPPQYTGQVRPCTPAKILNPQSRAPCIKQKKLQCNQHRDYMCSVYIGAMLGITLG